MKIFAKIFIIILILSCSEIQAQDYLYILNDGCINDLMAVAETFFKNTEIEPIRDSRGILLRFDLENPLNEFNNLSNKTYRNSLKIKDFLAKIENPVIIEVHTEKFSKDNFTKLKNWEISTIIANKVEDAILANNGNTSHKQIKSIGYGEFLPSKNTSNNGGKYSNRVDIIILCNIGGE